MKPLIDLARLYYYRWAVAELSSNQPMHPDLPLVVLRLNELERRA